MSYIKKYYNYIIAILRIPIGFLYCICSNLFFNKKIHVLNTEETIKIIIENKLSISRYGDGEIKLIKGKSIGFQDSSKELSTRLAEILHSNAEKHIVGILYVLKGDFSIYRRKTVAYWKYNMIFNRNIWERYLNEGQLYGDSLFTRFYVGLKDKSNCDNIVKLIKNIWQDRDLLIVEGEKSRLGVNNDLFDNAKSIKRILCPSKNSFSYYEDIKNEVLKYSTHYLILIALGPTATVLSYDLCLLGYQAIDIGHVDLEFEWYARKVMDKVPITGKYVNECDYDGGSIDNTLYKSQIECKIGCEVMK